MDYQKRTLTPEGVRLLLKQNATSVFQIVETHKPLLTIPPKQGGGTLPEEKTDQQLDNDLPF